MQTLEQHAGKFFSLCLIFATLLAGGCGKNVTQEAIESDANGYLCLNCGVKLYTPRSIFIGPKCPSCGQDKLMDVVGYYCEKDKHLTIRPSRNDPQGAPVCEICKTPLRNAMRMPREKDLLAWGAKKTS
jgi:hypothetical protein